MQDSFVKRPSASVRKELPAVPVYYELRLLTGAASFLFVPVEEERDPSGAFLSYNTEGLVSLDELFESGRLAELTEAMLSLSEAEEQLMEYLFETGRIVWNPEEIYWNPSQRQLKFLYDPSGSGPAPREAVREWAGGKMDFLMESGEDDDEQILFIVKLCAAFRKGKDLWESVYLLGLKLQEQKIRQREEEEENAKKTAKIQIFLRKKK